MAAKAFNRENTAYLVWQIISFALPVLVLALASRRISPTAFGMLAFAQGVAGLAMKIAEFGFNIVGPREVALHRESPAGLTNVFSGIMIARLPVAILLALFCVGLGLFAPYFRGHASFPTAVFLFSIWSCFQVMWYYQGNAQFHIAVAYEAVGRLTGVACMYAWLRSDRDAWMAIGWLAIGGIVAEIGLFLRIADKFDIRAGIRTGGKWLRAGSHTFGYRIAEGLYSNVATLTLPFFVAPAFLGNYSVAEKVLRATVRITYFIYGAAYPRFARLFREDAGAAGRAVLRVLGILVAICLAALVLQEVFARAIVHVLLGRSPDEAVVLLRMLALLILPSAITTYLCEAVLPGAHKSPFMMVAIYGIGLTVALLGFVAMRHVAAGPALVLPVVLGEAAMFAYSCHLLLRILGECRAGRPAQ